LPTKVNFGVGSLDALGDEASEFGAKKALILTDPGVLKTGLVDLVKEQLTRAKISLDVFSKVEPEPTFPRLNAAYEELRNRRYDFLIAVGGGSTIDTTKGLSIMLAYGGKGQDYAGVDDIPGLGIPFVAIPTTAGTGSEVTSICLFGDPERKLKVALSSPYLLARLAVVDPTMTYSCPPKITAACGLDALVHAIEAYTSKNATDFTDPLQTKAIQLIAGNLRTAVKDGEDKEARKNMAQGAMLAGFGIAHAGGAIAHAISYPISSHFHHIPHGILVGIMLSYVMEWNLTTNTVKYANVARLLGVENTRLSLEETARQGVEAAKSIIVDIGIPLHLRDVGLPKNILGDVAAGTMELTRLLANNPKRVAVDDVMQILENAW
jgi:alcohol dehydrogenase class IV